MSVPENQREILRSISKNEKWYENITDELRDDPSFIARCISIQRDSGKFVLTHVVKKEMLSNLEVAKRIISLVPLSLQYFDENVRDDADTVLHAVTKGDGWSLQFVSDRLKNDRKVVQSSFTKYCGCSLQYASEELRNDKELAEVSFRKSCGKSFKYIGDKLKMDEEFVDKAVEMYPRIWKYVEKCKSNRDVVYKHALENLNNLKYASDDIKNDDAFILNVVREYLLN